MLITASREGGMGKVELFHSDGEELGEGGEQQRWVAGASGEEGKGWNWEE